MNGQEERPGAEAGASARLIGVASSKANANDSQTQGVRSPHAPPSIGEVIEETTEKYLEEVRQFVSPPSLHDVRAELIYRTNGSITGTNALLEKNERHPKLRTLKPSQVAKVLIELKNVVRISDASDGSSTPPDRQPLAVYQEQGEFEGLYRVGKEDLTRAIYEAEPEITVTDMRATLSRLEADAPRVTLSGDPDLVPLNNTIYNYRTGVCHPFSPDIVLLSKARTNLVPDAQHPHLVDDSGERFDFDDWLLDLFDGDEQRVESVWQIIAALLRTNMSWGRALFWYGDRGGNGKGTLVELGRNIVGNWVSLPLSVMGRDFMLEPIIQASAIITDENDVGLFIDRLANFKALVTNDPVMINRKGQKAISFRFKGLMVQCFNEPPRVKDRTGSLYRRLLYLRFPKTFTEVGNVEKKEIKDRFMRDQKLLEYVVAKALLRKPEFYELSMPDDSQEVLRLYKIENDPARGFWEEFKDSYVWDLLPTDFLYSHFKSWVSRFNPDGKTLSRDQFSKQLKWAVEEDQDWDFPDNQVRVSDRMAWPELLIDEWNIEDWMNSTYKGRDPRFRCQPNLKKRYRGLVRRVPQGDPFDKETSDVPRVTEGED